MTAVAVRSWLLDKPPITRVVSRQRTHDARAELARAVAERSGPPPDWHQAGYCIKAHAAALEIAERVGTDRDVLTEALLWDDDVLEWCWSEVHERCCEETREIEEEVWWDGVRAIANWRPGRTRPEWIPTPLWRRLRQAARRGDAGTQAQWVAALDRIERDDDLYYASGDEATARHVEVCTRGSVGGDFHSTP